MGIAFYAMSGSPFAWRVWLALEHKKIPYELRMLSYMDGDLGKPEFLAISPRGLVPAIVDEGFALSESVAIIEYIDARFFTESGPLYPRDAKGAAIVRRMVQEADHYFAPAMNRAATQISFTAPESRDASVIELARGELARELDRWERVGAGPWLAGDILSAADLTLYPFVALVRRLEKRHAAFSIGAAIGPKLGAWAARVEALPYFARTYPPHWREG